MVILETQGHSNALAATAAPSERTRTTFAEEQELSFYMGSNQNKHAHEWDGRSSSHCIWTVADMASKPRDDAASSFMQNVYPNAP